jgi:hypothetical protein
LIEPSVKVGTWHERICSIGREGRLSVRGKEEKDRPRFGEDPARNILPSQRKDALIFILPAIQSVPHDLAIKQTTTVSTKGRVVLPKSIRGVLLKLASFFRPTRPEDVFGSLPGKSAPKR